MKTPHLHLEKIETDEDARLLVDGQQMRIVEFTIHSARDGSHTYVVLTLAPGWLP